MKLQNFLEAVPAKPRRPVLPKDIPGTITANPKTITADFREVAVLVQRSDTRKEIEFFVRDWNRERGVKEGKIVAEFLVGLLNRLAGGKD